MRSIKQNVDVAQSLTPAVRTASANGVAVDLLGYGSAMAIVNVGAIVASGDQTAKLQAGDQSDGSDAADVTGADLDGAFTTPLAANSVQRVGYLGNKRYLRVVITHNSGTSVATGAVIARGNPKTSPVA
jgi:hypothetical protein